MKKVLFVLVLMMSVLVLNAQATQTTAKNTKSVKTTIKVVDLQKAITDHIAKNYAGYTIKEATSLTKNEIMTYHVVIVRENTTETLVYDKDGKFIKRLPQKPVNHHSSKTK
jgi:hypothetical protein